MSFETLNSPLLFLKEMLGNIHHEESFRKYELWWQNEGKEISNAVDRSGTPWLRMFDRFGTRVDEILYPSEYWKMLKRGYQEGIVWRVFEENSLLSSYILGYITSFYDPGLYCPYIVSLSTAVPLYKYGTEALKGRFLPAMLRKDERVWQGATWMTEILGGSDLSANVETVAKKQNEKWLLTGDKYFASNVGADLAVVAGRPENAQKDIRGLALFLLPKIRDNGQLNYTIRRIKDKIGTRSVPTGEIELRESEGYLLGKLEWGIYQILEVLNLSRVANSVGSVALTQHAIAEAYIFARERKAFGKQIIEHPLLKKQFDERMCDLKRCFALAFESVKLLNEVWRETPKYSEKYHLFRLIAHLSKYWTAEVAVQTSKWAMEVHGGMGILSEYGVERLLREAMILPIWEGTPHRQILDGLEVMERKGAHKLLFNHLIQYTDSVPFDIISSKIEKHLSLPLTEKEAYAEELFRELAILTADTILRRNRQ